MEVNNKLNNTKKENNGKKWLFYFSILISAIIAYKILDNFGNISNWIRNFFKVLAPFVGGVLIAYILYLPCKKIEDAYKTTKKDNFFNKHARILSIATTYIMTIIILIIIFSFIIPILIQSLGDLMNNIPNYYSTAEDAINTLPRNNQIVNGIVNSIMEQINKIDFKSYLDVNRVTQYLHGVINAVNNIFNTFIAIVVSIYILSQRHKLVGDLGKFNHAILSEKAYKKLSRYFRDGNEIFFRFLTSQILDAFIVGALVSVAMLILKVKYAVLLGFMIGLFNLIPFFGAIIAVIIAIIITMLTGGIGETLAMGIVVIILQQIDANIINPKIVGSALDISQILVIVAVTIGGAYFGILGMFLAVPVATVIRMMVRDYAKEREEQKKLEEKEQE